MKPNTPSQNTRRAADESADQKTKAQENLDLVKQRDLERELDPNWTAVIVSKDDKTLAMKWIYDDSVNDSVL